MNIQHSTFNIQRPTPDGARRGVALDVRRSTLNVECSQKQRGSVLIIVLWVCLGLVSIALYFANSMTYELRASDNRVSGGAADQAIEGAARYVSYALSLYATNGAVPVNTQFSCAAVPVGDAKFWLIGRDPAASLSSAAPTEPYFGLVDEGSKVNLNTANTNTLSYLPNMTVDFANAILDWRGTNGAMSLDYSMLGYYPKYAPFETVDELRLVYGADVNMLAGDDINRNGVLDANETDTTGMGQLNSGLFEYTTVWTREPNFHSDGSSLTNVNTATLPKILALLQAYNVGNATTLARSIWNQFQSSGTTGRVTPCNNLLDLALRCQSFGMSEADFAKIYNDVTTSTNTYFRGRVNVNTASADVLTALFIGANPNTINEQTASGAAQTLITYRQQNPGNLNSIWWLIDALGNRNPVILALAGSTANSGGGYVTTKSFQFTADIAAVGPFGRGYRRVKFIFDTSEGTPIILYRQDLSRLGWALGDKARQTLLANNTPQ
jgi:DNA uptake protein ComE-like DNA-binding protein